MTTDQKLMTVKEVSHFLRLSLPETYRLVNSKALTHFRVGPGRGAIRIAEQTTNESHKGQAFGAIADEKY